jgi:hypothetical protein
MNPIAPRRDLARQVAAVAGQPIGFLPFRCYFFS